MALTTPLGAANAYLQTSKLANRGPEEQNFAAGSGIGGFADMLRDQVAGVVETGNTAEAKQSALIAGKADVVDVVTAVAETEVALETMVSVRDRVISAYEEIMRMPI
ncbi:flagellar hook-basal body complex protein FliE [Methylobrevis albus]|uniref:Flagellar hook-basal body complex protein FliE n=1 Tax=Methylobrevis albus TaxID=2793297 RepID=A0A931I070_9HYPH|nr:flagellar hook-basal body complex protein FliE [Methylobrevis albus]MBH0236883.1 flagellar hook-basal body complex protein FliE [Methylobrevis albus]